MIFSILTHFIAFILGGVLMFSYENYKKRKNHTAKRSNHNNRNKDNRATSIHNVQKKQEHVDNRSEPKHLQEDSKPVQSDIQEQKLSKSKLKRQQRKEDRARKKQEEVDRKTALAEQRRKQSFNPRTTKPENPVYTNLAVSDGRLVPCTVGQTYYYHFWEYEDRCFFEFFCEQSKEAKAVNNRSVIIDPFCQKDSSSVPVDEAKSMEIIEFGELDKELNLISKSIIRFK